MDFLFELKKKKFCFRALRLEKNEKKTLNELLIKKKRKKNVWKIKDEEEGGGGGKTEP